MIKKYRLLLLFCVYIYPSALFPQVQNDFKALYESGEFNQALAAVEENLNEIYSKRVADKRIPSGYISLQSSGDDVDLVDLFRNRKAEGFFIENNPELSGLHLYAARINGKLGKRRDALNHYIQSLRFREIEYKRDDAIFYEISEIFKSYDSPEFFRAYTDALEQAYTLNSDNYNYSLELGTALSSTREIKKALYHLERYVENTSDAPADILLKIASLYNASGNYIEAEKNYNRYLMEVPDNGAIHFALGYLAYSKTGNYILAESSFQAALQYTDENDIYRRSKSYEYSGDMAFSNLKYDKALLMYESVIEYQNKVLDSMDKTRNELGKIKNDVNLLKQELIRDKNFEKYEEYEILLDSQGEKERDLENLENSFARLNPGKVRWNIAVINEKKDKNNTAINYYRECIKYDYQSNRARERIEKLQLKIKRGY
jgi:tetratricopeptide (TPR) repeat protein